MDNAQLDQLKGKNWVAALLLCWFLGMYGGHRFYTGKTTTAWVMLLLSLLGITAPISAIWSLVDGFTMVFGDYRHEDGSPLYEKINGLGYFYVCAMLLTLLCVVLYIVSIIAMIVGVAASSGAGAAAGM